MLRRQARLSVETRVGDAEFFAMMLRIWLGDSPADWKLKDALLGLEAR